MRSGTKWQPPSMGRPGARAEANETCQHVVRPALGTGLQGNDAVSPAGHLQFAFLAAAGNLEAAANREVPKAK